MSGRLAFCAGAVAYLLGSTGTWAYYFHSIDVPLPAAFSIILGCSALIGLGALLLHTLAKRDAPLLAAVAPGALWCAVLYLVS
ncbi:MAG: acyltransferase, partial [Actinophytocola sp.]|nr:acyltransferase [Actinophytocola sp.]